MHIIFHLLAFILVAAWVGAYFFYHQTGFVHILLVLGVISFIIALFKHPGKRTTV